MQGGVNFRWFKIIRLLDQVFRADASLRFPRKKIFEEMWRSPDWGNYQGKMIILSGKYQDKDWEDNSSHKRRTKEQRPWQTGNSGANNIDICGN